ncbi:MAG: hypothetical protein IJJ84_12760 [Kiritimatiellae bacterium]|nr:hypothetical protein [Kiritimatiellia bacterium]
MNATTQAIVARLPRKPLLSPADIAAAYGLSTTNAIIAEIKTGRIAANVIGGKYVISRAAAEAYVAANEYEPEEGTIK